MGIAVGILMGSQALGAAVGGLVASAVGSPRAIAGALALAAVFGAWATVTTPVEPKHLAGRQRGDVTGGRTRFRGSHRRGGPRGPRVQPRGAVHRDRTHRVNRGGPPSVSTAMPATHSSLRAPSALEPSPQPRSRCSCVIGVAACGDDDDDAGQHRLRVTAPRSRRLAPAATTTLAGGEEAEGPTVEAIDFELTSAHRRARRRGDLRRTRARSPTP